MNACLGHQVPVYPFIRTSCLSLPRAVVDLVVDPIQAADIVQVQDGLEAASRYLHLCVVVGRLVGYCGGQRSANILTTQFRNRSRGDVL